MSTSLEPRFIIETAERLAGADAAANLTLLLGAAILKDRAVSAGGE